MTKIIAIGVTLFLLSLIVYKLKSSRVEERRRQVQQARYGLELIGRGRKKRRGS